MGEYDDEVGRSPLAVLSESARTARSAENSAAAQRVRACHALFRQCLRDEPPCPDARPGHAKLDPFDVCVNQLVVLFAISVTRATTMVGLSVDLCERCPAILGALSRGRIDLTAAERLVKLLRNVHPDVLERVQREAIEAYLAAIESGQRLGAGAVGAMVDEIIARHDPDGIRERAKSAAADRGVTAFKEGDGMATVRATLSSDETAVLIEALDKRADHLDAAAPAGPAASDCAGADGAAASVEDASGDSDPNAVVRPTLAQRRADALMSLVLGENPIAGAGAATSASPSAGTRPGTGSAGTRPGTDSDTGTGSSTPSGCCSACGSAGSQRAGVQPAGGSSTLRPQIIVIARPGAAPLVQFPRTGASTIAALLDLLAQSDGATLMQVDPTTGAHDDPDRAHTYRPTAALARAIRLRDGTCRHPGCTVAAEYGDIDHVIPFDHDDPAAGGPTSEQNNLILCRRHHRFKTFSSWRYSMDPDGILTITTPDGRRIVTEPSGPLADFRSHAAKAADANAADGVVPTVEDRAAEQASRNSEPTAPDPTVEPAPGPTFFTRRIGRIRTERRHNAEHREEQDQAGPDPTDSRPTLDIDEPIIPNPDSRIELAVAAAIAAHLDPPPF